MGEPAPESPRPGRLGSPSEALVVMVPLSADGQVFVPAMSEISWAGVRGGSDGAALALVRTDPAAMTATAATAPEGTAQRARRDDSQFPLRADPDAFPGSHAFLSHGALLTQPTSSLQQ